MRSGSTTTGTATVAQFLDAADGRERRRAQDSCKARQPRSASRSSRCASTSPGAVTPSCCSAKAGAQAGLEALGGKVEGERADPARGLAIDLGPAPVVCISARAPDRVTAARRGEVVGLLVAPGDGPAEEHAGGAGDRLGWLGTQRNDAGAVLGDDGTPDVAATALTVLALLGDGVADASDCDSTTRCGSICSSGARAGLVGDGTTA